MSTGLPDDDEAGPEPRPDIDTPWWARWQVVFGVALLLVIAAGVTVFQLNRHAAGPVAAAAPARPTSSAPSAPAHPDAYKPGTCLTEQGATGTQLTPVPCDGSRAVLVVDRVVTVPDDCAATADYSHHGSELYDSDARAGYCLSLVVPEHQCFRFSNDNSTPFQRAACGSSPDTVQVQALDAAPNAETACAGQTAPDVWFFSSPTSGRYACVTRPQS